MAETLTLPELALIVLFGSAVARDRLAAEHFAPDEVVSAPAIADFTAAYAAADQRLTLGRLVVFNAALDGVQRQQLVGLARAQHVALVAVVLAGGDPPALERKGFRQVVQLHSTVGLTIRRERLPVDRRDLSGPFDLIGDVHGCITELRALLVLLGYQVGEGVQPPPGRQAVFVGDLVDRGPGVAEVLALVMDMVTAGAALCVIGNHDDKLNRQLRGRSVQLTHGLAESVAQLAKRSEVFRQRVLDFFAALPSHYVLDGGRLIVAHAGLKQTLHGRDDGAVRQFALYGDTTGEMDAQGLPVRRDWAADYHGSALVVYGHTPVAEPRWQNNTVNIDTGCVFGGRLTALRYPERVTVSAPALRPYAVNQRASRPSQ